MRYIIIFEDGSVYKANEVSDDDKNGCDAGVLDVIDTETMKQYYENEWHDLKVWC